MTIRHHINFTPKRIAFTLGAMVMILLTIHLTIIYLHFVKGYEHLRGFVHGFYFDHEANIPSLYSTLAILLASILLWQIGVMPEEKAKKQSPYWKFLAIVFLFLAADEFGGIHEFLIQPMKSLVEQTALSGGYLYFAWLIPYTILTLILAAVFLRFYWRLPRRTKIFFFIAVVVFLSGAVVMEMVGGNYWAKQGWSVQGTDQVDLRYALIITVEESLEMVGIIIFVYALSGYYLARREKIFLVTLSEDAVPPAVRERERHL